MASLSSGGLGMGIAFTLTDHFTGVAKKIRAEQSRLKGSTEGLADGASAAMSKITSAKLLAGGLAVLAPLAAFVNQAAQLSDQLANVQKTTGLTDKELSKLHATIEKFDTRTSIADLLEIGTVGGRLGVAKNELEGFIETVDKAVVALGDDFSGGAEQIATELGKIKTLFGDTKNLKFDVALNQIGSALNELGNSGANSAPSVANFTRRIGQLGQLAPTLSQTLGLGATLEELGMRADIASGGVTNLLTVAGQNQAAFASHMGLSIDAFKDLLNASPNDMLIKLAESFAGVDNATTIAALKEMKIGSQESLKVVLGLANSTDLLRKRQALAAKAMREGVSLQSEFDIKNKTLQASIDKLTKKFVILGQRIGIAVAPVFMVLAGVAGVLADVFTFIVKSPIGRFILQLATATAMGAVAWGVYNLVLKPVALNLTKVAMASTKVLLSMLPIAAAIGIFLGLVYAIREGVNAFDNFNAASDKLTGSSLLLAKIGGIARGIMEIVRSWDNVTETFTLSKGLASKLQSLGILDFVVNLGTWIVRIIELVKGMFSVVTFIFSIIGKAASALFSIFTPLGNLLIWIASLFGAATDRVKTWALVGKAIGVILVANLIYFIGLFTAMGVAALVNIGVVIVNMALMAEAIIVTGATWVMQFIRMGVTALAAILPALLSIIVTIGTIVVSVIAMAIVWVANFIVMGIAAIVALLPVIAVVTLIGLAIWAVIKIGQWLIDKFHELWGESTGWLDFGKNMVVNIWEGVKSIWGQFTGWLSSAMKNIPGVGRFFEDEEATATLNQEVNTPTIGNAIADQKGLAAAPTQFITPPTAAQNNQPIVANLMLDSRQVAQAVGDKNKLEQARE